MGIERRIHKDKIKNITQRIDNNIPSAMRFPISKGKKEQMIEGKSNAEYSNQFITLIDRAMH